MEYLLWVDADMIVLDLGLRLEQVAAEHPNAHILISAEHAGSSTLINSGAVLVRNTEWSRKFLSEWWSFADRKLYSDQEQFDMLYKAHKETFDLDNKIHILPPDALNTVLRILQYLLVLFSLPSHFWRIQDPPAMTMQKPHNQVLHLMGEHSPYRIRAFKAALENICQHLQAPDPKKQRLSRQLTVTRENLLKWSFEEYSGEAMTLLNDFEAGAKKGGSAY